jgi:hypothetical protein
MTMGELAPVLLLFRRRRLLTPFWLLRLTLRNIRG